MMPELVKGTEDMGWMYEIVIVIFIFFKQSQQSSLVYNLY